MPFKNRTNLKYINMKNIFMLTNKSERKIGGKRFYVIGYFLQAISVYLCLLFMVRERKILKD